MPSRLGRIFISVTFFAILFSLSNSSAVHAQGSHTRVLITQNIDETNLVPLSGNVRSEANRANDRGVALHGLQLDHLLLQLKRPPEQEAALQALIGELHDRQSPNYHHWLTAAEFGERFGLAQPDLDTITGWLTSRGFQVNFVYPSRVMIDFSGTAAQVMLAFHTEIHHLEVNGTHHIANMSEPRIPAALAPAIAGIVSLHDFRPHPMMALRRQYTFAGSAGTEYALVPGDLATIYNFNPAFAAGITGQGQTIVLIENTDLYSGANDWNTFRSTFGLSGFPATLSQTHPAPPSGPNNCGAPGINADDGEAALDAQYATAAAPSAAIQMAACADTQTTFGGLIAMQNLVSSNTPPAIISVSYGECETANGAAANAAYNSTYQQAAAEGASVYVAAGDSGAASCDQNQTAASHGITVSGFASTPYNVAVGGTDFSDAVAGTTATYWNAGNTPTYASARSYVPEIPWDASCAGTIIATYEGYPTSGPNSFCNYAGGLLAAITGTATTAAGSGGPSGCAFGAPSITGVVSGSCAGYAKPAWQAIPGNPSDNVRDLPDVSLFAANGVWGHFYIFCYTDAANGGAPCTGAPSGWTGAGGTSFASPIMAGVQALINQKTGSRQGNPNPTLYSLAQTQFSGGNSASCNSSLGNGVAGSCVFYDVTSGDMAVECTTNYNCYDSAAGYGVISTSDSALQPAYGTNAGWDFATGIGTVNVANLVNAWPGSAPSPDFSLSASPASVTIVQGGPAGASTITVNPTNGFSGSVTLSVTAGLPSGVTASFDTNPATGSSGLSLTASSTAPIGTVSLTISGTSGALTHTTSVSLTVNAAPPPPDFTLSASPSSVTIVQGGSSGSTTITVHGVNGFSGSVGLSVTSVLPSGISAGFNPNPTTGNSTLTLGASSSATTGTVTVTVSGTSGVLTHTVSFSLTVNPAPPPDFSLSASPNSLSVARGHSVNSTISVKDLNGFNGSVSLSASGLPGGVKASFNPGSTSSTSTLTFTASSTASTGTFTVTIKGVSGNLNHTTTIKLTTTRH